MEQGFGEFDAALEAARKRAHLVVPAVCQRQAPEKLVGAPGNRRPGEAVEAAVAGEIFAHRQFLVEGRILEDDADSRPDVAQPSRGDVGAENADPARGRERRRGENAEERAFAAPVGAEDAEKMARGDVEGNVAERDPRLAAFSGGRIPVGEAPDGNSDAGVRESTPGGLGRGVQNESAAITRIRIGR